MTVAKGTIMNGLYLILTPLFCNALCAFLITSRWLLVLDWRRYPVALWFARISLGHWTCLHFSIEFWTCFEGQHVASNMIFVPPALTISQRSCSTVQSLRWCPAAMLPVRRRQISPWHLVAAWRDRLYCYTTGQWWKRQELRGRTVVYVGYGFVPGTHS